MCLPRGTGGGQRLPHAAPGPQARCGLLSVSSDARLDDRGTSEGRLASRAYPRQHSSAAGQRSWAGGPPGLARSMRQDGRRGDREQGHSLSAAGGRRSFLRPSACTPAEFRVSRDHGDPTRAVREGRWEKDAGLARLMGCSPSQKLQRAVSRAGTSGAGAWGQRSAQGSRAGSEGDARLGSGSRPPGGERLPVRVGWARPGGGHQEGGR